MISSNNNYPRRHREYSGTTVCNLASFHRLTNGNGTEYRENSVDEVAAVLLAIQHFNARNDSVVTQLADLPDRCDVQLTVDIFDTSNNPTVTVRKLVSDNVLRRAYSAARPLPCGILGPGRSAVAVPLSIVAASMRVGNESSSNVGIPVVSYSATSAELDNKGEHPLFGRTVTSTEGSARVLAEYLRNSLDVTRAAVIYVQDPWGESFRRLFQAAADEVGMASVHAESIADDVTEESVGLKAALSRIRELKYTYIVCALFRQQAPVVLREAVEVGLAGRDTATHWTFVDMKDPGFLNHNARKNTPDRLSEISSLAFLHEVGSIGVPDATLDKRGSPNRFLKEWAAVSSSTEFNQYLKKSLPSDVVDLIPKRPNGSLLNSKPVSAWASYAYDAAIAYGLAACNANVSQAESQSRHIFNKYFSGPDLYDAFLHVSFDGASGAVKIDSVTGTRDYRSVIFTMDNVLVNKTNESGMTTFGMEPSMAYVNETWTLREDGKDFVYSDGSTTPPLSYPLLELHNYNYIGTAALAIGYIMCGIVIVTAVYFAGWTWKHRKKRVVQSSQPLFMYCIALGAIISVLAIVPMSLQEPAVSQEGLDISCMCTPWAIAIGFSTSVSALHAKSLRINKLMLNRNLHRQRIRHRDVLKHFLPPIAANVLILSGWTAYAPTQWERTPGTAVDQYGNPYESFGLCVFPDENESTGAPRWVGLLFMSLLVLLDIVVAVLTFYEIYRGRHLDDEFNESKLIGISSFALLECWFIGLPIYLVVREKPEARFLVMSVVLFVTCQSILLILFVPKFHFLYNWRMEEVLREQRRQLRMKTPAWMVKLSRGTEEHASNKAAPPILSEPPQEAE